MSQEGRILTIEIEIESIEKADWLWESAKEHKKFINGISVRGLADGKHLCVWNGCTAKDEEE